MDARLSQLEKTSIQKDKAAGYLALLSELVAKPKPAPADIIKLVNVVVTQEHVGIVIGRQVISELAKNLEAKTIADEDARRAIIEGMLEVLQPRVVSYEEQVASIRYQLADFLEADEEWAGAARVLMGISQDAASRMPDEEKLKLNIRIVRLLLEEEDDVQAEAFYKRAALLVPSTTDRVIQLQFKLCQARIHDFAKRFLQAAIQYHELSWAADMDEEERSHALSAAVTCAVLAPAGPARSRILASLSRDERTASLPNFNILTKMFLDHVIRPAEVKVFEQTLRPHQLAKIGQSSNDRIASKLAAGDNDVTMADAGVTVSKRLGPETVLDRAVMEHNVLACSNVYNNISFAGLGALLDVTPGAAETMARKMIEQGRLRAWIDQVEKLIWFEGPSEEDDAQGKAGGLGDVELNVEETGAPYTKKWDHQIRTTAASLEAIVQSLLDKGLVKPILA